MKFQEPEVVEMGHAKELVEIYDPLVMTNVEGLPEPQTSREELAVYICDAE